MKTNNELIEIIERLKKAYPDAKCSLDFTTPFELGISVMLSAQCTDARVNIVTKTLFEKYNTPTHFININLDELEKLIFPCGFYKVKAKNIKAYAEKVLNEFNGELPSDINALMTLPGIGRKSANVIMLEAFNNPLGIAVDTHAKRISNRLGLSSEKDPLKIEQDLLKLYPKKYYKDINHLLVWHGRNTCTAKNPKCNLCPLSSFCSFYIDKQNI